MKIIVQTVQHQNQRYNTVGDWFFSKEFIDTVLIIRISDLGDDKLNALIAIHELVEAILCKFNDPEITGEQVDQFDMSHPELKEPGEALDCPYMIPHLVASDVEKMIADRLKVDWNLYEGRIREL
jgi:hypothetical protein